VNIQAFASQVRMAFMQSGPIPVCQVSNFSGKFEVTGVRRLITEVVPSIDRPLVSVEQLMSAGFQERLNEVLNGNPVILFGRDDLKFRLSTGKWAIIHDIDWSIEVHAIEEMEMDRNGVVGIIKYKIRPHIKD